jgi:AcrR family transcriptional regulator
VSRATFYIYFESKASAVASLAEAVTEKIYADLWGPFMTGEEPPSHALLTQHWIASLALWREHQAVLVPAAEAWRADPTSFDQWGAVWRRFVDDTRALIERARAAGQAPAELDAESLAGVLVWMNENALYLAFSQSATGLAADELLAETIAGVWMRAIYGPTPFK